MVGGRREMGEDRVVNVDGAWDGDEAARGRSFGVAGEVGRGCEASVDSMRGGLIGVSTDARG